MSNGIPLTDDDRWGWLNTLWREAVREINGGVAGCVVTCSCLKQSYRDVMREANREANVALRFIYLRADKQLLLARVKARTGHYMKGSMVESQFNDLEEPREVEKDVTSIDVSGTLESVQIMVMANVYRVKNEFS
jgi:gluconokinase